MRRRKIIDFAAAWDDILAIEAEWRTGRTKIAGAATGLLSDELLQRMTTIDAF